MPKIAERSENAPTPRPAEGAYVFAWAAPISKSWKDLGAFSDLGGNSIEDRETRPVAVRRSNGIFQVLVPGLSEAFPIAQFRFESTFNGNIPLFCGPQPSDHLGFRVEWTSFENGQPIRHTCGVETQVSAVEVIRGLPEGTKWRVAGFQPDASEMIARGANSETWDEWRAKRAMEDASNITSDNLQGLIEFAMRRSHPPRRADGDETVFDISIEERVAFVAFDVGAIRLPLGWKSAYLEGKFDWDAVKFDHAISEVEAPAP